MVSDGAGDEKVTATWSAVASLAGAVLVLACFCTPLFWTLGGWDQRNDEAIYSYAVDRILETGDWLNPRAIPSDVAFLEKPPLKFWIVAATMWAGWLPVNDMGMRFWDAVFGSLAFLYVYFLGVRFSGAVAGAVAVFVLFCFEPLIFEHGIRGNNMEGALILAYCGGMYHFVRWATAGPTGARAHAFAIAGYFVLGFMTKFVAALFLPMVGFVAMLTSRGTRAVLLARWRDWLLPSLLALLLIAPWFVYQSISNPDTFWEVLFGQHVYARFAATLEASHLQPWHHYFTHLWLQLGFTDSRAVIVLGLAGLVLGAFVWRRWEHRLLLIWFFLPTILISFGTSKLFYYLYPFLPALALGSGIAISSIAQGGWPNLVAPVLARIGLRPMSRQRLFSEMGRGRRLMVVLAFVCFGLTVWNLVAGPFTIEIAGVRVFRSSSALRTLVLGLVLLTWAGAGTSALRIAGIAGVAALMPLTYHLRVERLQSIDHPIRALRDCAAAVQARLPQGNRGVFQGSGDTHHAFFYYLRKLGPYLMLPEAPPDELARRLTLDDAASPILLSIEDYAKLAGAAPPAPPPFAVRPTESAVPDTLRPAQLPPALIIGEIVVILTPRPFDRCAAAGARAGGRLVRASAAAGS